LCKNPGELWETARDGTQWKTSQYIEGWISHDTERDRDCVIWTNAVNAYNEFDLDQARVFCKNLTIGCR